MVGIRDRFWVSTCWCRAEKGKCARSAMEVCLSFREDSPADPSGMKEVSRDEVLALIDDARERGLVSRMFARKGGDGEIEGICFCCDDCCYYFRSDVETAACDRGMFAARIDMGACAACGTCVDVCYFGAREIADGKLAVADEKCDGCGLCADVCPEACVTMAVRV